MTEPDAFKDEYVYEWAGEVIDNHLVLIPVSDDAKAFVLEDED